MGGAEIVAAPDAWKSIFTTSENSNQSQEGPRLHFVRIASSLVLAFTLLAASVTIVFVTAKRMGASQDWVLHTCRVSGLLKDLRSHIGETHAQFDLYEISGDCKEIVIGPVVMAAAAATAEC